MRRFWLPALMSSELPHPDCDPLRIQVLGEDLVAFRDTEGRVGVLDEHCRHRGASLSLGRVEECGIRCIYHGWKFDREGRVLETPNIGDPQFKERFTAKAYPVEEAGGLVWIYMGPAELRPEFPRYPFMEVDATHCLTAMAVVNCNFVQILEGLVDSSHLTILHTVGLKNAAASELNFGTLTAHMRFEAAPTVLAEDTEFGFHYVAMRKDTAQDGHVMARIAAFQAPCFLYNPNGDLWFALVPMNDERTMFFHVWWHSDKAMGVDPVASEQLEIVGLDAPSLDAWGMSRRTCDSPHRAGPHNGFKQDREAMRKGHFTGIYSFTQEDAVVSISGGGIRDRSKEMLGVADLAIQRLYRTLLLTADAGAEGREPLGLHADTLRICGLTAEIGANDDWRGLVPEHRRRPAVAAE